MLVEVNREEAADVGDRRFVNARELQFCVITVHPFELNDSAGQGRFDLAKKFFNVALFVIVIRQTDPAIKQEAVTLLRVRVLFSKLQNTKALHFLRYEPRVITIFVTLCARGPKKQKPGFSFQVFV
jgi:hypothetical protein